VAVGTHCPPNDQHPTTKPMTRETLLLSYYPIRTSYYCFHRHTPLKSEVPDCPQVSSRLLGDVHDSRDSFTMESDQELARDTIACSELISTVFAHVTPTDTCRVREEVI
jgi:hypothetical protein